MFSTSAEHSSQDMAAARNKNAELRLGKCSHEQKACQLGNCQWVKRTVAQT